jgi:pyrroloquinoline quinone biosynthesis protein D
VIAAAAIPYLPRGVRLHDDRVRGMKVLLAPERALKLDATGAAVLGELDGRANFAEIVARLAARYDAPPERIAEDAARFLGGLIDRRMVEVQ